MSSDKDLNGCGCMILAVVLVLASVVGVMLLGLAVRLFRYVSGI